MRLVVTGATGLIGRSVVERLQQRGDTVIALSRRPQRAAETLGGGVETAAWPDPAAGQPPTEVLSGADAVVNLLGEPVAQRWSRQAKERIHGSRVLGTRNLVAGIRALPEGHRPQVLISQSATGYYGPRGDEELDESAPPGDDFLAEVVKAWEAEALAAAAAGLRVCLTRTGVVLAQQGGALEKMLPPFKAGVGGPVAGGRQYLPWIHLSDVADAILHCLDRTEMEGPVNVTAPSPATNREFSRLLGKVLGRPATLPVPGLALKLLYGEMAQIVLTGQRAVPRELEGHGYEFRQPDLEQALRDVLGS
jgi:uncharacterized protein (TIGR01777 family)